MIKLRISAEGAEKLKQADADLKNAAKSAKGFGEQVDKAPKALGRTSTALKDMESWAVRTSLKLDVLAGSLLYVVDTAMRGAAQLQRFTLATGIPTAALQGIQAKGVAGGITPEEMAGFVTSLQTAGIQMQMTGANAGPWALLAATLGIHGSFKDPIGLVGELHKQLMKLRPEQVPLARTLTGQVGISEGIFAGLRNPRFDIQGFQKIYDLTQKNLGSMNDLNADWAEFKYNLSASKNAFVGEFGPAIDSAVHGLMSLLDYFRRFVEWMDRGSAGARVTKSVIEALAVTFGATAIAMSALAAGLVAASVAAGLFNLAFLPEIAIASALTAVIWGLVRAYQALFGTKGAFKGGGGDFGGHGAGGSWAVSPNAPGLSGGGIDMAALLRGGIGQNTSISQTNQFNVNEAGNPQRSVKMVSDAQKNLLNAAAYSAPAYSR